MAAIKKITILNFDLSNNSLGRAYIIAKALSANYDVKIVGPSKKGYIWEPLKNSDIKIIQVPYARLPFLLFKLPAILKEIDGDIIYAVKPRFTSFGFALIKRFFSKKTVILDIDDWELSSYLKKGFWSRLFKFINLTNPNSFFWTWLIEYFIIYADKITTVSTFLKNKYGGEIIPHAKDTDFLDPKRFQDDGLKASFGLIDKKVVMFIGTPREHKGIEDALKAVLNINNPDLTMVVVGANPAGIYEKKLKDLGASKFLMIGHIPYKDLPRFIMLADIIVIPQRKTPDSIGQIPSKLFDAMSMAKPIVTTKVSDISEILGDCGIIVNPSSPDELSSAIKWLLANPDKANYMGSSARERCIKYYSLNFIKGRLKQIIEDTIKNAA